MATQRVGVAELEGLISQALEASNVSAANAEIVAKALAAAECEGQTGHGLSRVPSYAAQAKSGKVDGRAVPSLQQTRAGSITVDAHYGFAYPAVDVGLAVLPSLARACGIGAAAITRSHHFGVAGQPCERLAAMGYVALAFGNTPSAMSAWGGRRPLFGTNPIAFAAPCKDRLPIVIDLALSEAARGRIMAAAQKGASIPPGWALDEEGRPTTDAKAALRGTLLPAGGAKGAALALMVEVLAAALTGANFAFEASSFFEPDGAPPAVGQFILAIDPAAFSGAAGLAERTALLATAIGGEPGARVPGARRQALRERALREGLEVDGQLLSDVKTIASG